MVNILMGNVDTVMAATAEVAVAAVSGAIAIRRTRSGTTKNVYMSDDSHDGTEQLLTEDHMTQQPQHIQPHNHFNKLVKNCVLFDLV